MHSIAYKMIAGDTKKKRYPRQPDYPFSYLCQNPVVHIFPLTPSLFYKLTQ